jgi:hypothetical protein
LQQSTTLSFVSAREQGLQRHIDDLRRHEEVLWRNKSREQWLTCKDLNTKFFHLSTLIKRRRNAIDFLKLPTGAWISDRQTIGDTLCALLWLFSLLPIRVCRMSYLTYSKAQFQRQKISRFSLFLPSRKFMILSSALVL